ncbi:MAG: 50S ribosome-binding GTPase [Gammaproteobacteria bacterium]|nr:50S ribosome-binding GTPase [Gammaproteobacteria bacterium]
MQDLAYNVLREKVQEFCRRASSVLGADAVICSATEGAGRGAGVAPLNLAFAGQYSAGKSSLIKMLTGIEGIKIGAGVTTDRVTQYHYKALNIWDTPGILAGQCEQHDQVALEAIASADLLVYVITNELFDDVVGAAFRDLCFKRGRAKEMMIVVNKSENDAADRETKLVAIAQVVEPLIPEDFPIIFTDAQSYFDGLDEDDEHERSELIEQSNRTGLAQAIDAFVAERGLYGRLTTPLSQLQAALEAKLDAMVVTDPAQEGLNGLLKQVRRAYQSSHHELSSKIDAALDAMSAGIIEQGNRLADTLDVDQEQFEVAQEAAVRQSLELCKEAQAQIQAALAQSQADLEDAHGQILNSPLASKVRQALEANTELNVDKLSRSRPGEFAHVANPVKLDTAFNRGVLDTSQKGLSWLAANAVGDATKTGLKSVSGSTLHTSVKGIGEFIGYKFKAWEAVKIADKIGKGAKFLGPALAVVGLGLQACDDYRQSEHAKDVLKVRREIRSGFRDYASRIRDEFKEDVTLIFKEAYEMPVDEINAVLDKIRSSSEETSSEIDALKQYMRDASALRGEIESVC